MDDISDVVKELKHVPFFSQLGDAPLTKIARAARRKEYDKGQMVFFENDPCDGFHYVRHGSVKIYKMSSGGREHILHTFEIGDTFAEVPTFDNGLCPANAQAVEDSELLLIRKDDFEAVIRTYPEVALGLLHHFAQWLRSFTIQLENLSLKDVGARLAGYLLRLADEQGERTSDGIKINLTENQQEIAARIGTVREIVSRTFRKFQEADLVHLKSRQLTILNIEGLKEMV